MVPNLMNEISLNVLRPKDNLKKFLLDKSKMLVQPGVPVHYTMPSSWTAPGVVEILVLPEK